MDAKTLGAQSAQPYTQHCSERGAEWVETVPGMTKRELFAAMAMQGFCSDQRTIKYLTRLAEHDRRETEDEIAEAAVEFADALLAQLAKDQP